MSKPEIEFGKNLPDDPEDWSYEELFLTPGSRILRPMRETDVLPDSVAWEVMRLTCQDWVRYRRHDLGQTFSRTRAVTVNSEPRLSDSEPLAYPMEIVRTGTSLFAVVQQWVEDTPSHNLAEYLRTLPLWDEVVERYVRHILFQTQMKGYKKGDERPCLSLILRDLSRSTVFERMFLEELGLPSTPGMCDFLIAESLEELGYDVSEEAYDQCRSEYPYGSRLPVFADLSESRFLPTMGLFVESLFIAPSSATVENFDTWRLEGMVNGSVHSTASGPSNWAGRAWERVGKVIGQHKQWWQDFEICQVQVPNFSGRKKIEDEELEQQTQEVLAGRLTSKEFVDWYVNYVSQKDRKGDSSPILDVKAVRQKARTWLYDRGYRKNQNTIL